MGGLLEGRALQQVAVQVPLLVGQLDPTFQVEAEQIVGGLPGIETEVGAAVPALPVLDGGEVAPLGPPQVQGGQPGQVVRLGEIPLDDPVGQLMQVKACRRIEVLEQQQCPAVDP